MLIVLLSGRAGWPSLLRAIVAHMEYSSIYIYICYNVRIHVNPRVLVKTPLVERYIALIMSRARLNLRCMFAPAPRNIEWGGERFNLFRSCARRCLGRVWVEGGRVHFEK